MKTNGKATNIILAAAVALLAYLCIGSIAAPMRFDSERQRREKAVKQRLLKIRAAEERHRAATGRYCGSADSLVAGGWLADSLRHIPYSNGKNFRLSTATTVSRSGKEVPLMECGAEYADYLDGLDENSIARLTDEAYAAGRYPGLRIGSLTEANGNAGNWEAGN